MKIARWVGKHSAGALQALLLLVVATFLAATGCAGLGTSRRATEPGAMSAAELARYSEAEGRLTSREPAERENAAVALLSMDHPRALDAVLKQMKAARDPAVRISMIKAAEFMGDRGCFQALLDAVKDPDLGVKRAAARALGRFKRPEEVGAVVALLNGPGTSVGEKALLLQTIGEGMFIRATPALLEGLKNRSASVRHAAWTALRAISGRSEGPDPDTWARWWQANRTTTRADVLERRVRRLAGELKVDRSRSREIEAQLDELFDLSKASAEEAPGRLIKALNSGHERIRAYAVDRIVSAGPGQLPTAKIEDRAVRRALRDALEDEAAAVRLAAVKVLVASGGSDRDEMLLTALSDDDPQVQLEAIDAMTARMGESAVNGLIGALASPHKEVRESAANALGKMGVPGAVPFLVEALEDKDENVRWFAVEGLRKLGAARAVPSLCTVLRTDRSARVREVTAVTLGELNQPAAVPALKRALGDESRRVQERVVEALQALAQEDFDRMMIIADALAAHGRNAAARNVLREAIWDFGGKPSLRDQLMEARKKLAEAHKSLNDYAGAAEIYIEMDQLTGGDPAIRSELLDCWIEAGEPARTVPAFKDWLKGAEKSDLPPLVVLGCETVARLDEPKHAELRAALIPALEEAAERADDKNLLARVRRLKGEPTGSNAGADPTP
ncbi:MAG: HEAT repeat domain-containing protein [Candidatus Brocadiia bacterium]|nr:HEAT repeat domain-containing protein [Candidatus Brocadiia bacterium]